MSRGQRLVPVLVVVVIAAVSWWGRAWWDERSERGHCRAMADQEAALKSGTRAVHINDFGWIEEPDGLSPAERLRFLRNVRREIDRCIANDVPLD